MRSLADRIDALERGRRGPCLACAIERLPVFEHDTASPEKAADLLVSFRSCVHPAGMGLADLIASIPSREAVQ